MALFQGLLFLCFGIGLLLIDRQSLGTGRLPGGSNWFKGTLYLNKDRQPIRFWFLFGIYGAAGLGLIGFSMLLLLGMAQPLPMAKHG